MPPTEQGRFSVSTGNLSPAILAAVERMLTTVTTQESFEVLPLIRALASSTSLGQSGVATLKHILTHPETNWQIRSIGIQVLGAAPLGV